jgi:predicted RNase H-like HicB family nuclease
MFETVEELTLLVSRDEDSGWLVASWDAPGGGGITTQGQDLRDLQDQVVEAVAAYFDNGQAPRRIRLHFVADPILVA